MHPAATPPVAATASQETPALIEGGWAPDNRRALERWLATVAARQWASPPAAVFDWDNTCIFNDVGEATLHYQLDRLALRLDPDGLTSFLTGELEGVELVGGVSLSDLRADILEAYAELYPLIEAGELEAARALPAHRDFRAKTAFLYEALVDADGAGPLFAYPWLVGWLAGFDRPEIAALVAEVAAEGQRQRPAEVTWSSATAGRTGRLEYSFAVGLCPQPEVIDLMNALERAGVRVFVVSASGELVVEAAAAALGYPVAPEAIYGIRLELEDGRMTTQPAAGYPVTWRQGKVELIRDEIGLEPILVAGDADTDYEMLTAFEATEVRLVINRNKHEDDIGSLYRQALEAQADEAGVPLTLLQGRHEARCAFQPSRETTRLGRSEPTSFD